MIDEDDPSLPSFTVTIDPDTMEYFLISSGVEYSLFIDVLNTLLQKAKDKDLPGLRTSNS